MLVSLESLMDCLPYDRYNHRLVISCCVSQFARFWVFLKTITTRYFLLAVDIFGYFFTCHSHCYYCVGFEAFEIAHVFSKLMKRLGYNKYIAQGGDAGAFVSKQVLKITTAITTTTITIATILPTR